jgi:signal transduction histidine kinase
VTVKIEKTEAKTLKKISQSSKAIKFLNTKNSKGYYVLSFTDNGIGISKEDQKKLFSRFFRSQKVLESKTEGTGLGLFITKSIVNMHNGDIWFTSTPGQGSTFYFSLPIN